MEKILTGKQLKEMLFEGNNDGQKRDLLITLPATILWKDYEKELKEVEDGRSVMNFKVSNFPTKTAIGKKCFICYRGKILGWMEIVGFSEKEFGCTTTGTPWKGKFVERSGKFHYLKEPVAMNGFQGFRYIN